MAGLLDEDITWAEFGKKNLDRRITKVITDILKLQSPTLVQSSGIPVCLEGKDLLCRARTGSGKTLCYAVPMVQRLLADATASGGAPMRAVVLLPTKELIVQVHGVITKLLEYCFDVLSAEPLLAGQQYLKAELPSILVTTPSSLLSLLKQRKSAMRPLSETLKVLVIDEADVMFSFGYEDDMRALCPLLPATYQAVLASATLSDEVKTLKGLMLHKPVVLKLEEPRVTGKLSQFYLPCHDDDKPIVLYALLKLQIINGKTLIFVQSIETLYRIKILLERFGIDAAALHNELPFSSRHNIIEAFGSGAVNILLATDDGLSGRMKEENVEEEEELPKKKKRKKAELKAAAEKKELGEKTKQQADKNYSITRGIDLKDVATVINYDMPHTIRDYVHRVGRCARGGATGTALSFSNKDQDKFLAAVIDDQAAVNPLQLLPMQLEDAEKFRYRVEDMLGCCKHRRVIDKYRLRELRREALKSEKLEEYFEEHPEEKRLLQRRQRRHKKLANTDHLQSLPHYLVPEQFAATYTPVQQAAQKAAAEAGIADSATKMKRSEIAKSKDPLQSFDPKGKTARQKRQLQKMRRMEKYNKDVFLEMEKKVDPETANIEELPPLSGRAIWKLQHGKAIRRKDDTMGERRRMTFWQRKREKQNSLYSKSNKKIRVDKKKKAKVKGY